MKLNLTNCRLRVVQLGKNEAKRYYIFLCWIPALIYYNLLLFSKDPPHRLIPPQRKTVENDNEPAGWVYCSGNWGRADSAQKQDHKLKSISRKYSIGEKMFTGISDKFSYSPFHLFLNLFEN